MRKNAVLGVIGLCGILSFFAGCGRNEEYLTASEKIEDERFGMQIVDDTTENIDILDIVKLGNYKNIEIDPKEIMVEDFDVERMILDSLANTQIIDGSAKAGDCVFISYTGVVDGLTISEESSDGVEVKLGSSGFISGFDEGIIGLKPGETRELNLTFPDPYDAEPELAGKEIIYTITMNSITRSYPELTEEWVHNFTEYSSIKEYREALRNNLEQEAELNKDEINESEIWNRIIENSKITKYLKSEVDLAEAQYMQNLKNYLEIEGINLKTYKKQMNLSDEDYDNQMTSEIQNTVKQNMVILAIADKEGYSIDDDASKKIISEMAEENQIPEESLQAMFGKNDFERQIIKRRVMDLITNTLEKNKQ